MTKFPPPFFRFLEFGDRVILVGVLNESQLDTLGQECQFTSKTSLDEGETLVVGVISPTELERLCQIFEPRSRKWRGQYQALAKAIVSAGQDLRLFTNP